MFKLNDICDGKFFKECPDTTHNYEDLLIDKFKKPYKNELRGFVHVRTFKTGSIAKDDPTRIPDKKRKLEDAKDGEENNLIRAAYAICCTSLIMDRPNTNEDGNVLMEVDEDDDCYDVEMVVVGDVINDEEEGLDNEDPPQLIVDYPPTVTPPNPLVLHQRSIYFLSSPIYLQLANALIHGTFNIEIESITENDKQYADKLLTAL